MAVAAGATRVAQAIVREYAGSPTPASDARVLGIVVALTFLTTGLLALQPALRLRRLDVSAALGRGAGMATSSPGERRTRNLLVAMQIALALVLVAAAGIIAKSLGNLPRASLGQWRPSCVPLRQTCPHVRPASSMSSGGRHGRAGHAPRHEA